MTKNIHMQNTAKTFLNKKFKYYLRWIFISAIIGVLAGTASAWFLAALEFATNFRESHAWLVMFLPIGGLVIGLLYHHWGKTVEGGNNLIIDEFHDPQATIPFRMAPLVFLGTIVTHFFGGSAGREGTAVQMGGSIADQVGRWFKLDSKERKTVLIAGMAGGFGSVFGVPLAGTFFGLEVLNVGQLHLWALVEAAIASFVAHHVTLAWGIHHPAYGSPEIPPFSFLHIGSALVAGVAFGSAARLFSYLTHKISHTSKRLISSLTTRIFVGGVIVAALFVLFPVLGRYEGLGVPLILQSIRTSVPFYDWLGKLAMTALTLGFGFKGGEVTPLLFIGSTMGNFLSHYLSLPLPLLAAIGTVAVFAGAANTPVACVMMGMELFGHGLFGYAALACFASYAVSGDFGIYRSQTRDPSKLHYVSRTTALLSRLFRPRQLGP
jgi:H+/Cl- antiporter ClcA